MKNIAMPLLAIPLLFACASQAPSRQWTPLQREVVASFTREMSAASPQDPPIDSSDPALKDRLVMPKEIRTITPRYGEQLRIRRLQGQVMLAGVIERDGTVGQARVISTSTVPEIDKLSLQAFQQWRYRPATLDGKPVRLVVSTVITYSLR